MLITFEGGEGSGKSTHAKSLAEYLEKQGQKVVLTREPGATALGQKLRDILLGQKICQSHLSEMLLMAADRAEHIESVVMPALKAGKIVICDRYIDSSIAYQIGGRGLSAEFVQYLNKFSSGGLVPDITFVLDIPVELGLERAKIKGDADRFESAGKSFHERVRAKYLEIAKDPKRKIIVLSGEDPFDTNKEKIIFEVNKMKAIRRGGSPAM